MGGLYVVVTLQQSSYIQHRAHAQQSWGEPSTLKKKACSLAAPWLFLVFVFCQLFEVLRNKFWDPCSPVISYEGVSWVILVQEMLLFDLFLLLQSTFQLPKATRRQAISWAIVARKIYTQLEAGLLERTLTFWSRHLSRGSPSLNLSQALFFFRLVLNSLCSRTHRVAEDDFEFLYLLN